MNTTIYKIDSKGKERFLHIWTEGNMLYQEAGIIDGNPVRHEKEIQGKNIGRSNETSPEQQAEKEAVSLLNKKLDKGYYKTLEEAHNTITVLPMTAKVYKKEAKKIDWNNIVYLQAKFDGMRCLSLYNKESDSVTLMSRGGKVIETMPHIERELLDAYRNGNIPHDLGLDGELYCHDYDFQENMSAIKKYREGITENIQFNIYDCILEDQPYSERLKVLETLNLSGYQHIYVVDTYTVSSENEVKDFHDRLVENGYEGAMIRWGNEGYQLNKRSNNLLKVKEFVDNIARIVDVIPLPARPELGMLVCVFIKEDNSLEGINTQDTFKVSLKMSNEAKEEVLKNKDEFIDKIAEIRFSELTDSGLPRIGVAVGLRLDK